MLKKYVINNYQKIKLVKATIIMRHKKCEIYTAWGC